MNYGDHYSQKYQQTILKQRDLTKADYNFARSYEVGNIVKFYNDCKPLGIIRGEYLEVKKINEVTNTIIFKKGLKDIRFSLKIDKDYESKLEVFKKDTIDLQKGMKLQITKNDQKLINSEIVIIEEINKNDITLKLENNTKFTLEARQLKHIDYGYCSTIHSSQGKTTDRLIAAISSHKKLNNQKAWVVVISRHRHGLSIYMDNKAEVQNQLITNQGNVKSAYQIIKNISFKNDGQD
jgi:ATP-dependent exoDNAse (exonuclease V) alpha subunit